MAHSKFERFLPISGIVAGVLFAGSFFATADEPTLNGDKPQPYVDWLQHHHSELAISAICGAYFAFFMLMFASHLRAALRSREGGESTYSSVAYAGGIGVAVSIAAMSMISLAESSADPTAAHTLAYLGDASWIPWAASSGVLMLGTGLGALRTLALPKWLAVTTVVLGVLSVAGPAGIGVFLVTPLWLIATGIVLTRRMGSGDVATPTDKVLAHA
ncbi:MAG: hypothetical protein JWM40_1379 [Frankiales bacterium]|nr:hypothetical protein [Frankiales bacterium]